MAILEWYHDGGIIDNYRKKMEKHQWNGEPFIFELDPSNDEESKDGASVDEQTQQGKDGSGDAEDDSDGDGGETLHDVIESSSLIWGWFVVPSHPTYISLLYVRCVLS